MKVLAWVRTASLETAATALRALYNAVIRLAHDCFDCFHRSANCIGTAVMQQLAKKTYRNPGDRRQHFGLRVESAIDDGGRVKRRGRVGEVDSFPKCSRLDVEPFWSLAGAIGSFGHVRPYKSSLSRLRTREPATCTQVGGRSFPDKNHILSHN